MKSLACTPPSSGRDVVASWKRKMRATPELDARAAILSVVAQPTRLRLLYVLSEVGEVCVCDLAEILGVTESAVSQHLSKFKALGLLNVRRDAQTLFYALPEKGDVRRLAKLVFEGLPRS